jgi:riboflavin kinase/FMN adenylyltransferase
VQVDRGIPENAEPRVLALGNFDGVHRGHQQLLNAALKEAGKSGIKCSVLLFDPHPLQILLAEKSFRMITTLDERIELFAELGVDSVCILPFTPDMARVSPREFMENIVLKLNAAHLIVGFNYTFGAKGKGTPADLQRFGEEYGLGVTVIQAQTLQGKLISSSNIREALSRGDIANAAELLGRYPGMSGVVVQGEQRGRVLGYPTANLSLAEAVLIPRRGVYVIGGQIDGVLRYGMMNIGRKPTFHSEHKTTVEIHFFDFEEDVYGKRLRVCLLTRLRDEMKFSTPAELKRQLERDVVQAKAFLRERKDESAL